MLMTQPTSFEPWKLKPNSTTSLARLLGISVVVTFAANLCFADNGWWSVPTPKRSLPESMLIPLSYDGTAIPTGGWVLIYRNGLQGPDVADREIQIRHVASSEGSQPTGVISWEIWRTRNDQCPNHGTGLCPDRLRILSVPDGYIALPGTIWVEEGKSIRVLFVPDVIG